MRAITRSMKVFGLATLLALVSCALFAAGAEAAPTGTPPSISPQTTASPQVGDTLTENPATWTGAVGTPTIQWLDCDNTGNNCTAVASNGTTGTYTVAATDVGSTIEVQETATDGTNQTTLTSGPTAVVGQPPAKISAPAISPTGPVQEGQQLTVTQGTWTNNPTSTGDQWMRCDNTGNINTCSPIHNATGPNYTLSSADVGQTIVVEETARNPGGSGVADSAPTDVVTFPPHPYSTTTTLLAVPDASITNQTSTLIATVTSSSPTVPPTGTVMFRDAGAPISGCSGVPVTTVNQSANVTCSTAFSAASSPEQLTAVFTPTGSSLTGSFSGTVSVTVGQDSTTTSLDVSNPHLNVGANATYTATVAAAHAGPFKPSGSVQFFDHGKLITSCAKRKLVLAHGFESAQCTLRYRKAGTHAIMALYSGNAGFSASASSQVVVSVRREPPRVLGTITARMAWKFRFTPSSTTVLAMVARQASPGTKITIFCRGRHCPFATRSMMVRKSTGCTGSRRQRCLAQKAKSVDLTPLFGGHPLPAGSHVTVTLTHPNWIGKAYLFTIRAGKAPTDQIGCLAIGSKRLGVGC